MKDSKTTLTETLDYIIRILTEDNYLGCSRICTDLLTFSLLADNPDYVFLGETLEAVFSQINPVMETAIMTNEERITIRNTFLEFMGRVKMKSDFSDKIALFDVLRDFRMFVTKQQFELSIRKKKLPETFSLGRRRI
ncbi:MAG TPA: hypothetical protein VJ792_08235 [Candidatus Nitrosotalea sp.]|nr:hypothetical protein [Candidatus Nitrosotalea sp.]